MRRTTEDIRSNLDYVGCDNDTALEMCAEIERLRVSLSLAGLDKECPVCGSRIGSCDSGMPPCPIADAR